MAFATPEDVATRLGRDMTELEAGTVEFLLDGATAVIAEAVDQDDAWATALTPVPTLLRVQAAELVVRAFGNPSGVLSLQETLGQYSHSTRYATVYEGGGLALTPTEELRLRRVVKGQLSGSARLDSMVRDDEEALP